MKQKRLLSFAVLIILCATTQAQVIIGGGIGGGYGRGYYPRSHRPQRTFQRDLPEFKPVLNISIGYGFPNLDMNFLPDYYHYYKGNPRYSGPINAAIDYQFSRNASIGLLVTNGHTKVNYFDYNNSNDVAMTGSLDSWSFMLNLIRYMPVNKTISPYIRTAIGISSYNQDFTDASGDKITPPPLPSALAYQAGIGVRFYVNEKAGFFAEAGYGKYIVNGGLTFRL